ncbi:MAG: type II toxin-antitoxin system VapC family toxin [Anaerolineae bacterium]|nr:type II toxin-antitoxin system VapC family toxin [Anaerolineae bacterium]
MLLIDSDILIDVSRRVQEAIDFVVGTEQNGIVGMSAITQMELMVGARNSNELVGIEQFIGRYTVVPLDAAITAKGVELLRTYNLSHGLQVADALIAATAIVMNEPFVTRNQRHYRFITGLKLQNYP